MRRHLSIWLGVLLAGLGIAVVTSPSSVPAQDGYASQIRERIDRWQKQRPDLVPAALPSSPGPSAPSGGGSLPSGGKAVALCIGLNSVNPAKYAGWSGDLGGCENDANDMQRVAESRGFTVTKLLTRDATLGRVKQEIGRFASDLKGGDIIMISYSGHGGQMRDTNGDEPDGMDETWCLYDGQIVDDEIAILMSQFKSDVRVLVFSDSCHSGSVTRTREVATIVREVGLTTPGTRDANTREFQQRNNQYLDAINSESIQALNRRPSPYRVMPDVVRKAIEADPTLFGAYEARTRDLPGRSSSEGEVRAAVLLISGCQDDQLSADMGSNGLFTNTFKTVWASGGFTGNYRQLREVIAKRMPAQQQPQLYTYGPKVIDFTNQRPFQK